MSHDIFEKWNTAESYKMFNSFESTAVKLEVESRKLSKRLLKVLPLKERRTTKIAKLIFNESLNFFESPVALSAISNSRKYKYVGSNREVYDTDRYPGTTVTVTEMYSSYSNALNEMRQ